MTNLAEKILNKPHLLGHYLGYDKLTEIHSQWIIDSWTNKKDYILQAHRNSYKTTAILLIGTIWYLIYNPESTILIVRKEYEGAASILNAISKLYQSTEMQTLYKELGYTGITLTEDKKDSITLDKKKQVTKEGNIESMGIGGAITGRHYDKILCDDIETLKDRISKAERVKTRGFVMELMNIKKAGGTITITGTPWHREGVYDILPEASKYPLGSIEIKELTNPLIEEIKQRTTPSLFAINYLLKHISDETKIFKDAKYDRWDNAHVYGHIDAAYSGRDYTSLTLAEIVAGKTIIKGWVWRESIVDLYEKISSILKNHNCGTVYMEDNADKGLGRIGLMNYYSNISGYHEHENKHNKIILHLKSNWPEVYFDYDCQEEYLSQILDYEEGQSPDDAPDSAASLLRIIVKNESDKDIMVENYNRNFEY